METAAAVADSGGDEAEVVAAGIKNCLTATAYIFVLSVPGEIHLSQSAWNMVSLPAYKMIHGPFQ
jgi:hypothetical protein